MVITAPQSDFMTTTNRAIATSAGVTLLLLGFAALIMLHVSGKIQKPPGPAHFPH